MRTNMEQREGERQLEEKCAGRRHLANALLPLCFNLVSCLRFYSFLIRHILTTNHTLYMATRNVIASSLHQNDGKSPCFDRDEKKRR